MPFTACTGEFMDVDGWRWFSEASIRSGSSLFYCLLWHCLFSTRQMTHFANLHASGLISLWRNIENGIETLVLIDLLSIICSCKYLPHIKLPLSHILFSCRRWICISVSGHFAAPNNNLIQNINDHVHSRNIPKGLLNGSVGTYLLPLFLLNNSTDPLLE